MTTTTAPTKKLICAECRHENEAERIYCHNCGERLDRSAVAGQKKPDESEKARRHLQKMMEGPSKSRQTFFAVSKLALAAAAAAALVQIALPPDGPPTTKTTPQQIDLELENLVSHANTGAVLQYSQEQINAYLTYRLGTKKKVLSKPLLSFVGATATLHENECTVSLERAVFGYSLFSRVAYHLALSDGKISAVPNGGWVGRLPIHPFLMKYVGVIFADLWSALDREKKLIAKAGAVNFHEASVTIAAPVKK
jgi:hypothetical protein